MLPSNPRSARSRSVSRQPTTSQPRSVSRPRERYSEEDDRTARGRLQEGGRTGQMRSQRSMSNMRPSRTKEAALPPPPPPPSLRSQTRTPARQMTPTYARPPPSRDSHSSASSISSSGSSLLDRMRQRGTASSSSQSSFEIDLDAPKETSGADSRKAGLMQDEQAPAANDLVSYGYSIWNRVATAASAWSGGSNELISGVSPSSGDSEITRALKTYHIKKARDRSDLPDWLFDERERGVNMEKAIHRSTRNDARIQDDESEPVTRARGRGFRDIYDSVATSAQETRTRGRSDDGGRSIIGSDDSGPSTSRATDRLKAIRDAKRQATSAGRATEPGVRRGAGDSGREKVGGYDRRYEDSLSSSWGTRSTTSEPVQRNAAPRVGLPTNPRRR